MTSLPIPPDALVLRPTTERKVTRYCGFWLIFGMPMLGGMARAEQIGTVTAWVLGSVDIPLVSTLMGLVVWTTRRTFVAVSDTEVLVVERRARWVERSSIGWVTRDLTRDTLRGADGRVLARLPDTLSKRQRAQLAAVFGVPHVDGHGRVIAPAEPG